MSNKPKFKLEEVRNIFYTYSGKASEIIRNLSLAGIAIVWILKTDDTQEIPQTLIYPLISFVLSLLFDLIQYLFGGVFWHYKTRDLERDDSVNPDSIDIDTDLVDNFTYVCMILKLIFMIVGHVLIMRHMVLILFPHI